MSRKYTALQYDEDKKEPFLTGEKLSFISSNAVTVSPYRLIASGLVIIVWVICWIVVVIALYYDDVRSNDVEILLKDCIIQKSPSAVIIFPNDYSYDDSRIGVNFRYDDFYPLMIVNVTLEQDIQASILCAQQYEVEVVPMNGGHSFEGASCTNGLLLHLDEYRNLISITRDEEGFLMTVQSGMRLGRLYGLVIDQMSGYTDDTYVFGAGTCPTVGVTGHILCGGYGYPSRYVGFTSDQIVSMRLVNSRGRSIVANNISNVDLFWAVRGACSSAFGIVSEITFRLTRLDYPNVTIIQVPPLLYGTALVNMTSAVSVMSWWQRWATVDAPNACTFTLTLTSSYIDIKGVCLSSLVESVEATLNALVDGLEPFLDLSQVRSAYKEVTFFEAVVFFTGDSSIETVNDLLAIKSLEPLDERSTSRRKAKSLYALRAVPTAACELLINLRVNGSLNQVEWKAYGGVNVFNGSFFSDDRSPLLRGKMFEMHYGNSASSDESDDEIVSKVNKIGNTLMPYFSGEEGYIGYIDECLNKPGADYFGTANANRLSMIRSRYDPDNVLITNISKYLYDSLQNSELQDIRSIDESTPLYASDSPSACSMFLVGSFSASISTWCLGRDGSFVFVNNSVFAISNPSWLIPPERRSFLNADNEEYLVYSVNQVSNFAGEHTVGAISAYMLQSSSGALTLLNSVSSGGASPNSMFKYDIICACEINVKTLLPLCPVDEASGLYYTSTLFSTNSPGTLSVVPVLSSGALGLSLQILNFSTLPISWGAASPRRAFDSTPLPYLHEVVGHDGFVYIVDRDSAAIYQLEIDPATGMLRSAAGCVAETTPHVDVVHETSVLRSTVAVIACGLALAPGTGPRHIAFHPSIPFAYVVSETANTLTVLSYSVSTGRLQGPEQLPISTLASDTDPVDMLAAELKIAADGRFIYVSNRDNSSPNLNRSDIAVFPIVTSAGSSEMGFIGPALQHIYSGGQHPRHFEIIAVVESGRSRTYDRHRRMQKAATETAKELHETVSSFTDEAVIMMVVANKNSDNLVSFFLNTDSGTLSPTTFAVSTAPYHDEPLFVAAIPSC